MSTMRPRWCFRCCILAIFICRMLFVPQQRILHSQKWFTWCRSFCDDLLCWLFVVYCLCTFSRLLCPLALYRIFPEIFGYEGAMQLSFSLSFLLRGLLSRSRRGYGGLIVFRWFPADLVFTAKRKMSGVISSRSIFPEWIVGTAWGLSFGPLCLRFP